MYYHHLQVLFEYKLLTSWLYSYKISMIHQLSVSIEPVEFNTSCKLDSKDLAIVAGYLSTHLSTPSRVLARLSTTARQRSLLTDVIILKRVEFERHAHNYREKEKGDRSLSMTELLFGYVLEMAFGHVLGAQLLWPDWLSSVRKWSQYQTCLFTRWC